MCNLRNLRNKSKDPMISDAETMGSLTQENFRLYYKELTSNPLAAGKYSNHEKGKTTPTRKILLEYIQTFVLCGGLECVHEANKLLESFEYISLNAKEIKSINAKVQKYINTNGLSIVRQLHECNLESELLDHASLLSDPLREVKSAVDGMRSMLVRSLFPIGKSTLIELLGKVLHSSHDSLIVYELNKESWSEPNKYSPHFLMSEILAHVSEKLPELEPKIQQALMNVEERDDYFYVQMLLEDMKAKNGVSVIVLIDDFDLLMSLTEMSSAERFPVSMRAMYTSFDSYLSLIVTQARSSERMVKLVRSLSIGSTFYNGMGAFTYTSTPDLAFPFAYVKEHALNTIPNITSTDAEKIAMWSGGMPLVYDEIVKRYLTSGDVNAAIESAYQLTHLHDYFAKWWERIGYLRQKVAQSICLVLAALLNRDCLPNSVLAQRTISDVLIKMREYGLVTNSGTVLNGSIVTEPNPHDGDKTAWTCTALLFARWIWETHIKDAGRLDYNQVGELSGDFWIDENDWDDLFNSYFDGPC